MKKLILSLFLLMFSLTFGELKKDQYTVTKENTTLRLGEGLFYVKDHVLIEDYYTSTLLFIDLESDVNLYLDLRYYPKKNLSTLIIDDFYTSNESIYQSFTRDLTKINNIVFSNKEDSLNLKVKNELNSLNKYEIELTSNDLKKIYKILSTNKFLITRVYFSGKYFDFDKNEGSYEVDNKYQKNFLKEFVEVPLKRKIYDLNLSNKTEIDPKVLEEEQKKLLEEIMNKSSKGN